MRFQVDPEPKTATHKRLGCRKTNPDVQVKGSGTSQSPPRTSPRTYSPCHVRAKRAQPTTGHHVAPCILPPTSRQGAALPSTFLPGQLQPATSCRPVCPNSTTTGASVVNHNHLIILCLRLGLGLCCRQVQRPGCSSSSSVHGSSSWVHCRV